MIIKTAFSNIMMTVFVVCTTFLIIFGFLVLTSPETIMNVSCHLDSINQVTPECQTIN